MSIKTLGILGGCFDPVHLGHLWIAEQIKAKLGLDKILFIPAGYQWLKRRQLSLPHHRLRMLQLALGEKPFFDLSRVEIDRPGPSYTVETLRILRPQYPGVGFYFILGWDALLTFPQWKEPGEIIRLAYLVVVPRGLPLKEVGGQIKELGKAIPGLTDKLILIEMPLIDISAAEIRRRVKEGLSISHLVPPEVEKYIKEHGLYK